MRLHTRYFQPSASARIAVHSHATCSRSVARRFAAHARDCSMTGASTVQPAAASTSLASQRVSFARRGVGS